MEAIIPARSSRTRPSAIGPQNGSSTHSQDQAITPVSFRVTKIRPSTEQIPIFIITSIGFTFIKFKRVLRRWLVLPNTVPLGHTTVPLRGSL